MINMARKLGAKKTHHCHCGRSGYCSSHWERCEEHQIDYYKSDGCGACNNRSKLQAQRQAQARQQEKVKMEQQKKDQSENDWYAGR
jgi:hypothetical protein